MSLLYQPNQLQPFEYITGSDGVSLCSKIHNLGIVIKILKSLGLGLLTLHAFMCSTQRCYGPRALGSMGRDNDRNDRKGKDREVEGKV